MNVSSPVFLVFGKGWIGTILRELLETDRERYHVANSRMENREAVTREIENTRPTHVLLAAGATGIPNVDWCEDHKEDTVRSNVIGVLNVIDICYLHGIHVTYYASGCIFHYDEEHPEGSDRGFKEADSANFLDSFYAKSKGLTEQFVRNYSNVLTLRFRLPIAADLINTRRNVISKILTYKKVVNIKNSVSVLPELIPLSIEMARKRRTGIMNFTNPGSISHNEILSLYKEYIDPEFEWENFTLEEQATVLKAPRSNAQLDSSQLEKLFPSVLPIKESIIKYVFEPAQEKKEEIKASIRSRRQ